MGRRFRGCGRRSWASAQACRQLTAGVQSVCQWTDPSSVTHGSFAANDSLAQAHGKVLAQRHHFGVSFSAGTQAANKHVLNPGLTPLGRVQDLRLPITEHFSVVREKLRRAAPSQGAFHKAFPKLGLRVAFADPGCHPHGLSHSG